MPDRRRSIRRVDDDHMTVTDAATALGISGARVRQLIAEGKLDAQRVGQTLWLVTRESVARRGKEKAPVGA